MKISYAITVKDELLELKKLVTLLLEKKRDYDEIVIVYDSKNGSKAVEAYLKGTGDAFKWFPFSFQGHFAAFKNYLTLQCTGDYIFQIDADEMPHERLLTLLPEILQTNPVDVIQVPRVNTVEGLTEEHIQKWGWNRNDYGWINWPDYQWRIYKNLPSLRWKGKVHERLDGFKTISQIPPTEELALHHPKTIERQEKQNEYYSTL